MPSKRTRQVGTPTSTLYVKNMVCDRCIRVVTEELKKIALDVRSVTLGEVVVAGSAHDLPMVRIKAALEQNGFELIEDKRAKTIEQLKLAVLRFVRGDYSDGGRKQKLSVFLSRALGIEYYSLSALFSSVENVTIEQYVILQRVERAKELLKYGELTLSEIAFQLGYSSTQHLSNQFKTVTGLTPTKFRSVTGDARKPLDAVIRSS